jgi:uncharacterized membrane protein
MSKTNKKGRDRPAYPLAAPRRDSLDRPTSLGGQVHQGEMFPGAIAVTAESFAGPLPPPVLLGEYEEALPGLAERIVSMAENEGSHRRGIECRLIRLTEMGLPTGFILSLVAMGGGMLLVWAGKGLEGLAPLILSIVGIVTIFVLRRDAAPADSSAGRA